MNCFQPTGPGRVLLADDDEVFRDATTRLLRHRGFAVEGAADAATALALLRSSAVEVLIADICMPGNANLELLRELPQVAAGLPVILLTGQPTVATAAQSIRFDVEAYLLKPVDVEELVGLVRQAIANHRAIQAIHVHRQRLQAWTQDLDQIQAVLGTSAPGGKGAAPWQTYLGLSLHNIIASLVELKTFIEALAPQPEPLPAGHRLESARPLVLLEALRETIAVLEKSKTAFKSRELGELRAKLEQLVQGPRPTSARALASAPLRPDGLPPALRAP